MGTEVWYRKWRPQTFAEVVGQPHVTRTLARAVQQNRVAHAYLFCGPRGTGKTSTARILAKAVNCTANQDGQPCGVCESCQAMREGRALDLIEMDAASNRGIDEIRSLRDKVGYSPNASRFKVYLIDEVHELTQFAFDALLKTLEEPPPHVIFVLATTEAHKLPETILSRCQRFDFVRAKLEDAVALLRLIGDAEGVQAEDEALALIARRATGSLRDSVNLFEQAVATQGRALTADLVRQASGLAGDRRAEELIGLLVERELAKALELVAEARDDGRDLRQLTREAVQYLRSLLLVRAGAEASLALGDEALRELRALAESVTARELLRLAKTLSSIDFRADPQSPLPLELAIVECIEAEPAQAGLADSQGGASAEGRQRVQAASGAGVPAGRQIPAAPSSVERIRAMRPPVPSRNGPVATPITPYRNGDSARSSADLGVTADQSVTDVPVANAAPAALATEAADTAVLPSSGTSLETDAPAPVQQQETPVVSGAVGLTLAEAQSRFRELYDRCRAIDRKSGGLLNSGGCDIVEVGPTEIVIGFQHQNMVRLATGQAYEPHIRQSVKDIFGPEFGVKLRVVADVPNRLQLLSSDRPSHLLDEALKLGAKPVGSA